MKKNVIEYFMSPSSPWTYLGSKLFTDLAEKHQQNVYIYPVNFGKIFAVSGGLPLPKRAPQRRLHGRREPVEDGSHSEAGGRNESTCACEDGSPVKGDHRGGV